MKTEIQPCDPMAAQVAGLTTVHSPYGCANHKPVSVCGCDDNVACLTCGYGHGQIPCKCQRTPTRPPQQESANE